MKSKNGFLVWLIFFSMILLIGCNEGNPNSVQPTATAISIEELESLGVTVDRTTGEVSLPEALGLYSQLLMPPAQTCSDHKNVASIVSLADRFVKVMDECDGQYIETTMLGTVKVAIRSTILSLELNQELATKIWEGLQTLKIGEGLERVLLASFVLHRSDGQDGLPIGNLIDFKEIAMTGVEPNLSVTFSSVPITGNLVEDIHGFATESCQSWNIAKSETDQSGLQAETICNGYGTWVSLAWLGWPYSDALTFVKATAPQLADGRILDSFIISEEQYNILKTDLAGRPDLFLKP